MDTLYKISLACITTRMDFNICMDILQHLENHSELKLQEKCVAFIAERMSEMLTKHGDRLFRLPAHLFIHQILRSKHLVLRTSSGIPCSSALMQERIDEISNEFYARNPLICRADTHPSWLKQTSKLVWNEINSSPIALKKYVRNDIHSRLVVS